MRFGNVHEVLFQKQMSVKFISKHMVIHCDKFCINHIRTDLD